MADTKISDLTPVTDVQAGDLYVIARGSTNNSIDGASLLAEFGGGGGGGGATVVFDDTLVADAASFDVTGIPDTFTAIGYSLTGRGDTASNEVAVRLRMNGDSGSNYEYQRFFEHSGNNPNGSDGSSQSSVYIGELPAATGTADRSGTCKGEIHGYADTTFDKIVLAQAGRVANLHIVEVITGSWLSTAAIDQLTFFPASGDFLAGTRLTVYGGGVDSGTSSSFNAYALIQDIQNDGALGGTFTSGAWRTRVLNTEVEDAAGIVTLASNQFTLAAGSYRIVGRAPGVAVDNHAVRLRNITDSTTVGNGESGYAPAAFLHEEWLEARAVVTLAGSKTFELQHRCAATRSTDGFGVSLDWGENTVFATVEIWRYA